MKEKENSEENEEGRRFWKLIYDKDRRSLTGTWRLGAGRERERKGREEWGMDREIAN